MFGQITPCADGLHQEAYWPIHPGGFPTLLGCPYTPLRLLESGSFLNYVLLVNS